MRTFLLKKNKPIISWGGLPPNTTFKGEIPEGYDLAINLSNPYIIIDVDRHSEDKNGFEAIQKLPTVLQAELLDTFNYPTKRNGRHFWFKYTGDKALLNKASSVGIDLRTGYIAIKNEIIYNGGYVKFHPRDTKLLETALQSTSDTSEEMNKWLESLFA